jgi:signal transduction histidine kinase
VPSRDSKVRAGAAADASVTTGRPALGSPVLGSPVVGTPALGNSLGATDQQPTGSGRQAPSGARPSRRSLKNWRVRSRLLLLIIIPTLTALLLGTTRIVTSVQSALAYQRVEQLANLGSSVTYLAAALQDERDQTVQYIAAGSAGRAGTMAHNKAALAGYHLVKDAWRLTDPWISKVRQQLATIGSGYPAVVQTEAGNISTLVANVPLKRQSATTQNLQVLVVIDSYNTLINRLLAIDDNIALGSGDAVLANDVRVLGLMSRIDELASEQRGYLDYAFGTGVISSQVLADVQTSMAEQTADLAEFRLTATPSQGTLYNNTVSGALVDEANKYEAQAVALGGKSPSLSAVPTTVNEWNGAMTTGTIGAMRTVQQDLVSQTVGRAAALRRQAIVNASVVGGGVLIVLLLALLLTTLVGRSMVRPLRRLRSGALEVAGVRLPETVRRMSDSDGTGMPLEVEPIDVDSTDEIGEVARAFDQVHREALRLAANEAALRGNVNAMFVNLSRRSQSLVERQIRLIDDLEQGEQDADRLSSLFQMDHLATRMRRNSENLLVLAGHDASRRWNQPVALVDVLRAAVSEIEQYERVTLNVQPGIAVRGHAVNDVVHLLAELAENATSFSSAETPVVVAGHLLSSGGVLLDITDQGVGMGAEEMAHANWRLDNPPVVDVAVSRRMGLFVVARLAARHGIRVRLRPAAAGGLTALVWLPDEVISHEAAAGAPGMRRFDPNGAGSRAAGASAYGADVVSVTDEINAARAPKFASLQAEAGNNGGLGPRRVPGAGPHPGTSPWGAPATTSPLPVFGSSSMADDAGTGEAPVVEQTAAGPTGSYPAEQFGSGPMPTANFGSGPMPVMESGLADAGTTDFADLPEFGGTPEFGAIPQQAPPSEPRLGPPSGAGWSGGFGTASGFGSPSDVVVPPAEHVAAENRLPIFEAVESDWFRRGRSGLGGWPAQPNTAEEPEHAWSSPSDQGWEAAAAVSSPATGGTTTAGLPKRVPQANLVPGTAAPEAPSPTPVRSAAATRERFASFQRGIREGRAAATSDEAQSDGDDGSR